MDTHITVGVPEVPFPESTTEKIAAFIRKTPQIAFAYLPELFIPLQMDEPSPVLLLITVDNSDDIAEIIDKLKMDIANVLPEETNLDVLPLDKNHELVSAAISTGCLVEINDQELFESCQE